MEKAESEYRKILGITHYHVESHIGLGEVYVAMGDEGDTDTYSHAIAHFTEAIKIAQSGEGSKRLKKQELAAVLYSRGYARVKLYENSTFVTDESLLSRALDDFNKCVKNDPEHYKGRRAIEKLSSRIRRFYPQFLTEKIGPFLILVSSAVIFTLSQWSFWSFLFNNPNTKLASELSSNITAVETQGRGETKKEETEKETESDRTINAAQYILLTFGSLTFMVVSLYLPQLLKLKIAGIELEKSTIDQIKVTGTLGISK